MTTRQAAPSFRYSNGPSIDWAWAMRSFIDECMATLCICQWQRAPITCAKPIDLTASRRRP